MTPALASPEQIPGAPASTASDVYSPGVTLYRLLTGRRPYELEGLPYIEMERIVLNKTFRPSSINPALRGDLDNIRRHGDGDGAVPSILVRRAAWRRYRLFFEWLPSAGQSRHVDLPKRPVRLAESGLGGARAGFGAGVDGSYGLDHAPRRTVSSGICGS